MRASIRTRNGIKMNIYQVHHMREEDDKIILCGDMNIQEPMLIGFDTLPETLMSTYTLTLYKLELEKFQIN